MARASSGRTACRTRRRWSATSSSGMIVRSRCPTCVWARRERSPSDERAAEHVLGQATFNAPEKSIPTEKGNSRKGAGRVGGRQLRTIPARTGRTVPFLELVFSIQLRRERSFPTMSRRSICCICGTCPRSSSDSRRRNSSASHGPRRRRIAATRCASSAAIWCRRSARRASDSRIASSSGSRSPPRLIAAIRRPTSASSWASSDCEGFTLPRRPVAHDLRLREGERQRDDFRTHDGLLDRVEDRVVRVRHPQREPVRTHGPTLPSRAVAAVCEDPGAPDFRETTSIAPPHLARILPDVLADAVGALSQRSWS